MKVTIMIGLPGSGKSTYCNEFRKEGHVIVSSDEIRYRLQNGIEYNPDLNKYVFNQLHDEVAAALLNGYNAVVDATNLNGKRRVHMMNEIKHRFKKLGGEPKNITFDYVVVATPIEDCIMRDLWRDESVGSKSIIRLLKSFNFPREDEINGEIVVKIKGDMIILDRVYAGNVFEQDSKYHKGTLGMHIDDMLTYSRNMDTNRNINKDYVRDFIHYHDLGKLYTKTFINSSTGELDDTAHFYGHENVSSYIYMAKNIGAVKASRMYDVTFLIENHMTDLTKNKKIKRQTRPELIDILEELQKMDKYRGE